MPNPLPRRSLLPLPLLLPFRPASAEDITPDAILARLAAHLPARAIFREQRRFAALDTPLESTGHLVVRPGYLEKATDWPQPERLQVEDGRVTITAGNDPPRVVDLARVPELATLIEAIRAPLSGDARSLHRAFSATATGTAAAWTLTLTPRDPAAAKLLRSAELQGQEADLQRLTITQANGDTQTMTMTTSPSPVGRGPG